MLVRSAPPFDPWDRGSVGRWRPYSLSHRFSTGAILLCGGGGVWERRSRDWQMQGRREVVEGRGVGKGVVLVEFVFEEG